MYLYSDAFFTFYDSGGQNTVANLFYNMGRKTVGLVGLWDCVAFDEVAGIRFKDKDGVQIMKDYTASGSFARGKEEKAASASMVFVGKIKSERRWISEASLSGWKLYKRRSRRSSPDFIGDASPC